MSQNIDLFQDDQNEGNHQYIVGKLKMIFFESNDNFYKVMLVTVSESSFSWNEEEIVVTGNFADIEEEVSYKFIGSVVDHPKYGQQFQSINYQRETPTSKKGFISYLSGEEFKGIGEKTAEKIYDELGSDAINKMLDDKTILCKIGLKQKQISTINDVISKNNGVEQTIVGLNSYGFSSNMAGRIFKEYQDNALKTIQENPYKLVEDIDGISFKKADQVAVEVGIGKHSSGRIRAAILTGLQQLSTRDGNTYATSDNLVKITEDLLNFNNQELSGEEIGQQLIELAKDEKIIVKNKNIYLKKLYDAEVIIAQSIKRIKTDDVEIKDDDLKLSINKVGQELNIDYDESQQDAIFKAISNSMFLLTGGPGTGKTTIINGIVKTYAKLNNLSLDINSYKEKPFPILLAAPTGRAAKRMSESTGLPASTIHRLLGLNRNDDEPVNDLDGDILIIDEMSMIDTPLFKMLLESIPRHMKVIMVGDKDQLPSVGPGQVFHDLLESDLIVSKELDQIHRQEETSTIIRLAHSIKDGRLPDDFYQNQPDRSFIKCNANQIESVIKQVVARAKQKGFNSSDIQILAPMYRGSAGINNLNKIVQDIMNPKTNDKQKEIEYNNIKYRIGDKVLQLVNSPEDNVFNGDIGKIVGIEYGKNQKKYEDKLTIAFDQTEVVYSRKDFNNLTLAYCTSIHKAQGSEFKLVIMPVLPQYRRMLKKNLLYTGITRASSMLILLGDPNSISESVKSESDNRLTTLRQRLFEVFDKQPSEEKIIKNDNLNNTNDYILTETKILNNEIDPMIGMDNVRLNY
ncbi:ATP-dependent RecD-like DNA helicase [Lactobacillus sp. S2-2]|uniref:SF1B family DNA helicase RecD2 n=1 Tax=Lactobacillus sp. S2-2 TaxID=2692917 RepID=UPI001F01205D|nr:ATP-dependent RecD-like DNA helicase [Lactobacillus sp. S2-2]MCF6514873.1 ATP-dependent RecD-like DNA helicase [Lactobacillus sp. S2-2]